MSANAAVAASWSEFLEDLGQIPADRVLRTPQPGTATFTDALTAIEAGKLCELVDGTLVEKAMGWQESLIAAYVIELLGSHVRHRNLGLVTGADGFIRLFPDLVRGPHVAYFSWSRLPKGQTPTSTIPNIVPDLAVEVISAGNTRAELVRKRHEYFRAGVSLVWMIDPRERTVAVYTSPAEYRILSEGQVLEAESLIPGLQIPLTDLFGQLDRSGPTNSSLQ